MEKKVKLRLDTVWATMGYLVRKGESLVGSCPRTLAWNRPGIGEVGACKRTLTGPDQSLGRLQQALSGAKLP